MPQRQLRPSRFVSARAVSPRCGDVDMRLWRQVRLSERNVVELITKVKQAGLLGDDLLHTIDGREYITPEHLKAEVCAAVDGACGRMPVVCSRWPPLGPRPAAALDSKCDHSFQQ